MTASQALSKIQIRAEAELRHRAQLGDPVALSYLYGYDSFAQDPIGFNDTHLHSHFTDDIKRVIESVRDNTVTIAISANAVGKSFSAAHVAVWFYKVFNDAKVFLAAAPPEKNLKQILWGEIGAIVRKNPHMFRDDKVMQDMLIERNSESFISGLVIPTTGSPEDREAKFSGKHAPHLLFIVDEGDAVPMEVYKGIDSCMSGGHARLLIMFNPRADRGYVAGMVKKRQGKVIYLSAFDHPNVITGEDQIPGAVTRAKTIERINEMSIPLAPGEHENIECFRVPDYLVGQTTVDKAGEAYPQLPAGARRVTNPELFYKVLGKYPPQSEYQLISRVLVEDAQSRWLSWVARYGETPPPNTIPICALDVADVGDDSNVLSQKWGTWIPRLRVWSGVDPDSAAIKSGEVIKELGVDPEKVVINVDSTGVGAGVAPRMRRLGIKKANRVMVGSSPTYKPSEKEEKIEFFQLRDQLWWMTMMWLKTDTGAMLPPDEALAEELCTPIYWKGERDGKIHVSTRETMVHILGHSPDRASSLVLLFAPSSSGAWVRNVS